jgi:hypothetical protein
MQHPEPSMLELVLRQIVWNLAGNASTLIVALSATVIIGLGPIGRGIGRFLGSRGGKQNDKLPDPTQAALAEIAERLDFMERALLAIRSDSPALPEPRAMTPRTPTPV